MNKRFLWPLALLVCLLPFSFAACGETAGERYTAFACGGLEADATWEIDGVSYSGHLSLSAGDSLATREASITYTAPAALAGLTVQATGGTATLSLDGVSYTAKEGEAAAFLEVFRFFAPVEDAGATRTAEGETFTFRDGEGEYTVCFAGGRVRELCFVSPSHRVRLVVGAAE